MLLHQTPSSYPCVMNQVVKVSSLPIIMNNNYNVNISKCLDNLGYNNKLKFPRMKMTQMPPQPNIAGL